MGFSTVPWTVNIHEHFFLWIYAIFNNNNIRLLNSKNNYLKYDKKKSLKPLENYWSDQDLRSQHVGERRTMERYTEILQLLFLWINFPILGYSEGGWESRLYPGRWQYLGTRKPMQLSLVSQAQRDKIRDLRRQDCNEKEEMEDWVCHIAVRS